MRVLAVVVLSMISMSCKSTSSRHYEIRSAGFVVPTFEEDEERERESGDDSASQTIDPCDQTHEYAGECVHRTKSAKLPSPVSVK